jgi:ankyrin repeat protein
MVISARAISHAASYNKLQIMRFLVKEHGADVNQTYQKGCSPLFYAARGGHVAMVRFLCKELAAQTSTRQLTMEAQH